MARGRPYRGLSHYLHKVRTRSAFREKLRKTYGSRCFWCGMIMDFSDPLAPNYASVEHLLPRSDKRVASIEFIRLACVVCNKPPVIACGADYDEKIIENARNNHVKIRGIEYIDGKIVDTDHI